MNQTSKPLIKLFPLIAGLLGTVVLLIGLVVGILYFDHVGLQPTQGQLSEALPATAEPKSKALMDPVGMWTAPDWGTVDTEPY